MRNKNIPLDHDELFDLCKNFTYSNSWSDVDYIKLLKHFNPSNVNKSSINDKPTWSNTNPVLRKMIIKLREMV